MKANRNVWNYVTIPEDSSKKRNLSIILDFVPFKDIEGNNHKSYELPSNFYELLGVFMHFMLEKLEFFIGDCSL